ncbi:MAG: hypothetical protein WCJ36_00760 [Candidatus Saccharibacteria bacterium]
MEELKIVSAINSNKFVGRHRLLVFIIMSIVIATVLVVISMAMYNSSGAAQLDLSRPGYKSVRSQAIASDGGLQTYSAVGTISQSSITEFKSLFTKQVDKVKTVDAFGGDPLSPDSLGIGAGTTAL